MRWSDEYVELVMRWSGGRVRQGCISPNLPGDFNQTFALSPRNNRNQAADPPISGQDLICSGRFWS